MDDGTQDVARCDSKFAAWIDKVGAPTIARALGVTKWTVYGWRDGARGRARGTRPDPSRIGAILEYAKATKKGRLSARDLYPTRNEGQVT
jgi:hypothetical protein